MQKVSDSETLIPPRIEDYLFTGKTDNQRSIAMGLENLITQLSVVDRIGKSVTLPVSLRMQIPRVIERGLNSLSQLWNQKVDSLPDGDIQALVDMSDQAASMLWSPSGHPVVDCLSVGLFNDGEKIRQKIKAEKFAAMMLSESVDPSSIVIQRIENAIENASSSSKEWEAINNKSTVALEDIKSDLLEHKMEAYKKNALDKDLPGLTANSVTPLTLSIYTNSLIKKNALPDIEILKAVIQNPDSQEHVEKWKAQRPHLTLAKIEQMVENFTDAQEALSVAPSGDNGLSFLGTIEKTFQEAADDFDYKRRTDEACDRLEKIMLAGGYHDEDIMEAFHPRSEWQ